MKVFGKGLQQLTFDCCRDINLEDLLPYHQLESLRILSPFDSSISSPSSKTVVLASKEYFPHLKSLESQICLGSIWSRVFEEKSTLTIVSVSCLLIGTEVCIFFAPLIKTFILILLLSFLILMYAGE